MPPEVLVYILSERTVEKNVPLLLSMGMVAVPIGSNKARCLTPLTSTQCAGGGSWAYGTGRRREDAFPSIYHCIH